MNDIRLGFAVFSVIVSVLVFGIWSNIEVYAQQASSNSSGPLASPQQHASKIKITSPTKGQQVPVGKDLTVSGTSVGSNATSNNNDCKVSVIVNNVKPYQQANPGGTTTGNYSKWNFVLTSKYTTVKPGQNKITAKYECASNPASKSFSSVNVTGVQGTSVAATSATIGAASVDASKLQRMTLTATTASHNPISHSTGYITWATIASLSNSDNTSSSLLSSSSPSTSTIAPQATALRQQPQQPLIQVINTTGINNTAGQNYTFATISPTLTSGKLMYLGYHGDSGGSSSSSRSSGQSTAHSTSSNGKSSSSSDSKPSSHHSNMGGISDSAIEKKKTDSSSSSKSHSTSTTTNVDSGSDAKSSSNSNTKSSSHTNHDTGSSSDLGSAIRNKVGSIVKNNIKRITGQIP